MCESYNNTKRVMEGTCNEEPKRPTAAQEVIEFAIAMVDFSKYVEDRVYKKLQSVTMPSASPNQTEETKESEFPPLFNELRNNLQAIQTSLSHIDWMIDRTEL
jgi:hypothetical protein